MKRPITITRTTDSNRNQFMLTYENGFSAGPFMDVGLRGEHHMLLTLAEGPNCGEKGIRFPSVGRLSPGESTTVTDWELGLIREQFEPLND